MVEVVVLLLTTCHIVSYNIFLNRALYLVYDCICMIVLVVAKINVVLEAAVNTNDEFDKTMVIWINLVSHSQLIAYTTTKMRQ
jgi:hypothetical protein